MKKNIQKIVIVLFSIIILLFIFFQVFVYLNTYKPSDEINNYVSKDDYVFKDNMYIFNNENINNEKAILFYGGGLVDPFSYSYLAKLLKDEGYLVIIPKFFNNLSIFNSKKGNDIIEDYNDYSWYLMGHSLGGVSAASLLKDNNENISGIIFLASYPTNDVDLSNKSYKVLSITASNDGVLNYENYENMKKNLPKDTQYSVIQGGNHAYFGMYGEQKKDNKADITVINQQEEIVNLILNFDL